MNVNFCRRPGVPGPPIPRLLVIFWVFFFFFHSDRPTKYQETHSSLNEKKRGMALDEEKKLKMIYSEKSARIVT